MTSIDFGLPTSLRARAPASPSWAWETAVFVVVLLAVLAPILFLVLGSFSAARLPSEFTLSALTLRNYVKVWSDPSTYQILSNTLLFAGGSTLFGLVCAAGLAWLVERSDMPGKIWVYAGLPMTLAMPGMLQAMAWTLLVSPRVGFINKGLMAALGLESAPFNIYSLPGMIFVEGLRMVPTAFLMLVPLLRSMDPSLEEAAAMCGARQHAVLRKVTLGLMLPGLIAVTIYQFTSALEEFEVAGILGLPAGINVFSTKIYSVLHVTSSLPSYGEANALAMLYLALSVAIPFLVLLYVSFLPYVQSPSLRAFASMSLSHYAEVFQTEDLGHVLWNTVVMTVTVALAVIVLSFLISVVVVRSRFWGRRLLDQLAFVPHAIPGMVMGLALLWVFLKIDKLGTNLFGSLASVIIAFVIGYISYGTRVMNGAVLQIHKDLEEAAKMSGATQWRAFWRVFVPLLQPAFVGVGIWTILHVIRSAGKPLILTSGADSEVIAVTIWNLWDQGYIEMVGAIGTLLMLTLLTVTLLIRRFGFGRTGRLFEGS